MSDFTHKVDEAKQIFSEELIIGNHDSITLFGIHAQNRLREYSRKIISMLLKESEDIDYAISETIAEIKDFERKTHFPQKSILGNSFYRKGILKEFKIILSYIDKMELYFKLQQAQLIKEVKLLEKLAEKVKDCSEELEQKIVIGKNYLLEQCSEEAYATCRWSNENISSDMEMWYFRLEKRINDLSVSHTISMQNYGQIKLLHDNNLMILDKIATAIANTFPVWQNQMAIMLGIELLENRLEEQEKIVTENQKYFKQTSEKFKKKGRVVIDDCKIKELNESLLKALEEMTSLKEETKMICDNIVNSHVI